MFPPAPPELEALQRLLHAVIAEPRGARRAVVDRPQALALLHDGPPIDRPTRLSVYGDAYFLRALEALSSDHPATLRALGEDGFQAMAAEYLASHPSRSPSLADFGASFPAFAARHRFSTRLPFLDDLVRLERAVVEALLTARLPPLDPQSLAGLATEQCDAARLVFDPTLRVLDADWPVLRLWERRGAALDASGRTLRRAARQTLVLWRDDAWVRVEAVAPAQGALLRRLSRGAPLGALFAEDSGVSTDDVRRWFAWWTEAGLVKRVEV